MTRRQLSATAALILLAVSLTTLLGLFDARRRVVAAEGNDLRTGQSVRVTATLADLLESADAFEAGTKVFVDLDEDVRAVAVLAGSWSEVPLHSGRALTGAPGEALVGADVEVSGGAVAVGGTAYEVVGRLGTRTDSLLSRAVVVADPSRFSASPQPLLLDGPDSARHYTAQFPDRRVEVVDDGTNRRTNVDTVSPVLATLGAIVAALIAVIAGVQAGRWELRTAAVRFTAGVSPLTTACGAAVRIGVVSTAVCAVTLTSGAVAGRVLLVQADITAAVVTLGAVVLTAGVAAFRHGSRRWNC